MPIYAFVRERNGNNAILVTELPSARETTSFSRDAQRIREVFLVLYGERRDNWAPRAASRPERIGAKIYGFSEILEALMFWHEVRVSILWVDFQPILPFLLSNEETMMFGVSNDFPKDYAVRIRWRCGRNPNHLDHTLLVPQYLVC